MLTAFGICGAALGLFACYLRLSATFPVGSDGASNALEAWDLLHGNWLLRGVDAHRCFVLHHRAARCARPSSSRAG